jgi:hypothetical protein
MTFAQRKNDLYTDKHIFRKRMITHKIFKINFPEPFFL